ncbi:MAG TPA: alpha/beta fold hydrolase [Steroidobacteraceae bacterium]
MPTVTINGARINYVQLCEGDATGREDLVMVHGLATNMAFWYFKYACEFAKQFRVTLFDLRGHGRSEMTPTGYAPANLARDMAGLLDHLRIDKAHFIAHSFGGVVTMSFALKHMHRVKSMVLADTHIAAVRHVQTPQEWAYGRNIQSILDRHGFALDTRDTFFGYKLLTRVAHMQLNGVAVPSELMDLVNPVMNNASGRTAAQWLKLMDTTAAEAELMGDDGLAIDALRAFKFPIVAMYGERSPARLTGTELLKVWPHAAFRNIRDAGHFFPASRPQEVVLGCMRFWRGDLANTLRRHRPGEARRSYFRSDRVFMTTGGWYFMTRETDRVGPFPESEQARAALNSVIAPLR